jgi:protein-glutamine gamma-glutamyltransferase
MNRWLNFFEHSQANPTIEDMWQSLFMNLLMSLVPFVFVAPLPATLTFAFLAVISLGLSLLGWRIPAPISYSFAAIIIIALRTTLPHGSFSGEFFTMALAVLALSKSFNLKTYGDGEIFLILTLAMNSTILLLDTDSSVLILLWTFGMIIWTVGNLLRINIKDFSSPALLASLRSAAQATLYTLPLLIFLFYIFQKFSHAPIEYDRGESTIGLSRSLEPGKVSKLVGSSTIAMRVKTNRREMPFVELYWKGPALSRSMGMRWEVLKNHKEEESFPTVLAPQNPCVVGQLIYAQRSDVANLKIALDEPIPGTYSVGTPYKVFSNICNARKTTRDLPWSQRAVYLKVEGHISEKVRELALELKRGTHNEQEFAVRVFHYFKTNKFKYSLTPNPLESTRTLDDFLFEKKEGFCEHYAASFATLSRLAGVPARVITGFQGGTFNKYGDYWVIGHRDAHAWVEIWEKDHGWVRMDPTAIVAPNRILQGARDFTGGGHSITESLHLDTLWMMVDAFFFWIRGLFDNRETLMSLDDITFNPFHLSALGFVLLCWLQVRRLRQDYVRNIQKQFNKLSLLLNERTIPRSRSEGFDNYRKRLLLWLDGQKNLRPLSPTLDRIFQRFIRMKYSSTGLTPHELESLYREIKTIQRALRLKTNFFVLFFKKAA